MPDFEQGTMPLAGKLSAVSLTLVAPPPLVTPTVVTVPVQSIQGAKQVVLGKGPPGIDILGVLQYHIQGVMPQQQPQRVDVAPGLEVAGGKEVPEAVGTAATGDPGTVLQ